MTDTKSKYHCNECGRQTNHSILFEKDKPWSDSQYEVSGSDSYMLIECCGCESVKLVHEHWFSEYTDFDGRPTINKNYYPPSLYRPLPKWLWRLDEEWEVTKLLKEVYSALQNEAPSLSVMGIRAIIEFLMIEAVGDNGSFIKNMNEFQNKGYISPIQKTELEKALEAGHASIHRGFIPEKKQDLIRHPQQKTHLLAYINILMPLSLRWVSW